MEKQHHASEQRIRDADSSIEHLKHKIAEEQQRYKEEADAAVECEELREVRDRVGTLNRAEERNSSIDNLTMEQAVVAQVQIVFEGNLVLLMPILRARSDWRIEGLY